MFTHELLILRHGQTTWNAVDRMQGRLNSPLTELGRAQAARQGEILAGLDLTGWATYASPKGRAFHTAGIALAGLSDHIRTDDRLCEIDVGAWNGVLRSEVKATRPELFEGDAAFDWYDQAPGGEGYAGLEARCRSFLDTLHCNAVLVTHGITSRVLRCVATGNPVKDLALLPGGQGNIYHFRAGQISELT